MSLNLYKLRFIEADETDTGDAGKVKSHINGRMK